MFERLSRYRSIVITGPHRSGTTIAAEMIGKDTGKKVFREEAFQFRNIVQAEALIRSGGVFQGPYLLPWAPILPAYIIYMDRSYSEIDASLQRLKSNGISMPYFDADQASRLWRIIKDIVAGETIEYAALRHHPLWVEDRSGWSHRQTSR